MLDREEAGAIDALAIALQIDGDVERHVTPEAYASELEAARAKNR